MNTLAKWEHKGYHVEGGRLLTEASTWEGEGTQAPMVFRVASSPPGYPVFTVMMIIGEQVGVKEVLAEAKMKVNSLIDEGTPFKDLYCYECSFAEEPTPSFVLEEFECKSDIRQLLGV